MARGVCIDTANCNELYQAVRVAAACGAPITLLVQSESRAGRPEKQVRWILETEGTPPPVHVATVPHSAVGIAQAVKGAVAPDVVGVTDSSVVACGFLHAGVPALNGNGFKWNWERALRLAEAHFKRRCLREHGCKTRPTRRRRAEDAWRFADALSVMLGKGEAGQLRFHEFAPPVTARLSGEMPSSREQAAAFARCREGLVWCCRCGDEFRLRELRGRWLERRCPLCGGILDERVYDGFWNKVGGGAFMQAFPSPTAPAAACADKSMRLKVAASRYLASEWHLMSAVPAEGLAKKAANRYLLLPDYDAAGCFILRPVAAQGAVAGIAGELVLFEQLLQRVRDPLSPLHGARLVPRMRLASIDPSSGAVLRAEPDCVMFLRDAAFVFEVKHRNVYIRVQQASGRLWESTVAGRGRMDPPGEGPLGQCARYLQIIRRECAYLPPERIGGVVVYVDPLGFESDMPGFPEGGDMYVGECAGAGAGDVAGASDVIGAVESRVAQWGYGACERGWDAVDAEIRRLAAGGPSVSAVRMLPRG